MALNQDEAQAINELASRIYEVSKVVKIQNEILRKLPTWLRKGIELPEFKVRKPLPLLQVAPQMPSWTPTDGDDEGITNIAKRLRNG